MPLRRAIIAKSTKIKYLNTSIIAGIIGNALEWYDFGLYGYLAATIGELFFPASDKRSSLALAFSVFAIGLFMRPVGGLIIGHYGDKLGRRFALILSILSISVPTFLIGILPTYAVAGIWSSIMMLLLRMVQGLSVGGEFIGAIVFLGEYTPHNKRGLICSLVFFSSTVGGLLGSFCGMIVSLLPNQDLVNWGWRIPFLIALPVGLIGLYLRQHVKETPPFQTLKDQNKQARSPIIEAFKLHRTEMLAVFGLIIFQAISFYTLLLYSVTWLTVEIGMPKDQALPINLFATLIFAIFIIIAGHISDILGRRKVIFFGLIALCVLSYPLFASIQMAVHSTHPFILTLLPFSIIAVLLACFNGPLAAHLVEMTPLKNRFTTLAAGYNFSAAIFGGTAPLICTALIAWTGVLMMPAFYVSLAAIISLIVTISFTKRS
ncbi:MAG: MFS transporter [Parachlamydiales bacterium]|nr:MFS transporter [Parachlamydiales bacterium]